MQEFKSFLFNSILLIILVIRIIYNSQFIAHTDESGIRLMVIELLLTFVLTVIFVFLFNDKDDK